MDIQLSNERNNRRNINEKRLAKHTAEHSMGHLKLEIARTNYQLIHVILDCS